MIILPHALPSPELRSRVAMSAQPGKEPIQRVSADRRRDRTRSGIDVPPPLLETFGCSLRPVRGVALILNYMLRLGQQLPAPRWPAARILPSTLLTAT